MKALPKKPSTCFPKMQMASLGYLIDAGQPAAKIRGLLSFAFSYATFGKAGVKSHWERSLLWSVGRAKTSIDGAALSFSNLTGS